MKTLVFLFSLLSIFNYSSISFAQTIPASRLTDWSQAGHVDSLPTFSNTVNIKNFSGSTDGSTPNDTPLINAIAALNGKPGTIYLPAGDYLFKKNINIDRDSIIIKGDGGATRLLFDLDHAAVNAINITGAFAPASYTLKQTISRNDTFIILDVTTGLQPGDYLFISEYNTSLIFSSWAYQSLGQVVQVTAIQGNTIYISSHIRRNYPTGNNTTIKKVIPAKEVGFECLYIERKDSTAQQTDNINFNKTANCWVVGVESYMSNFSHVSINYSAHLLVRGCYFHHAHSYGGNGEGYGVTLEYASGDCLVENNTFEHLRHSMLVQAGANGNVLSYNYSFDPNWTQPPFPTNAGGDMVCHGNYPYFNLFEGNIGQSIIVDDSHGINGPYNTYFRNRAELYGIYTNNNPSSDSQNFIGNEVTNTGIGLGLYTLNGNGNFEYGNNIKSVITPAGTINLQERSLYLDTLPAYWWSKNQYPPIGNPKEYNQGSNTAKERFAGNQKTDCTRNPVYTGISDELSKQLPEVDITPNPFQDILRVNLNKNLNVVTFHLYNITGQEISSDVLRNKINIINTSQLLPGMYIVEIVDQQGSNIKKKLIKVR